MYANLQNGITNALAKCDYENIQDQLEVLKKTILFQTNKISWNDFYQKYTDFPKIFQQLERFADTIDKAI